MAKLRKGYVTLSNDMPCVEASMKELGSISIHKARGITDKSLLLVRNLGRFEFLNHELLTFHHLKHMHKRGQS